MKSEIRNRTSNGGRQAAHADVVVRVPATTANVGTGFDALGIALGLSNRCFIRRLPGQKMLWKNAPNAGKKMMKTAAALFFKKARCKKFGFLLDLDGDVPIARGLGSSVTLRLGLLAGLNKLAGLPLDREDLLSLATELEGHPDNAAPALMGGLVVSTLEYAGKKCNVRYARIPVDPALRFILIIPELEIETDKARKVLPRYYSRADAVHNLSRACLLTAAFLQRRYDCLWTATDDRLHQPHRARLFSPLYPVLESAKKSGALGGWLSGSGSTVCLVAKGKGGHARIIRAIRRAIPKSIKWSWKVVPADNRGFTFIA